MGFPRTIDPVVVFSKNRYSKILRKYTQMEQIQFQTLKKCLDKAANTDFGKKHHFSEIQSYNDYKQAVPVRKSTDFVKEFWQDIYDGKPNVCWPGKIDYFIITSGTTQQNKNYIPMTREGLLSIRKGAMHNGMFYVADTGSNILKKGRQLIIGGDWNGEILPNGGKAVKISGIVPASFNKLLRNRLIAPSEEVANITNFNEKLDRIVEEAGKFKISQIASMPIWLTSFVEKAAQHYNLKPGQTLKEIWPDLEVCTFTGASIEVSRNILNKYLGDSIQLWEQYGASEGVIAIKESRHRKDLLVLPDIGNFFEFIPVEEYGKDNPERHALWEVECGKEYVLVMTGTSGLFSYDLKDTVRFTSTFPHRLVVSGRTSFFLNTLGEHMTQQALQKAIVNVQKKTGIQLGEFTVGPGKINGIARPHHHWILSFKNKPVNLEEFRQILDKELHMVNSDYNWFRKSKALECLKITEVSSEVFKRWITIHKNDDAQAKVPMVTNNRAIIEQIEEILGTRTVAV